MNRQRAPRPDPGGVAGVCFALAALIVIGAQLVHLLERL